jgi:histidine ammonia-lyase
MAPQRGALLVGGVGAPPGLDDVAKVAHGLPIVLDTAGSDRIKKDSPPPKAFEPEAADANGAADAPSTPGAALPLEQARAVLVVRLLSIMNGKSGCRLQVAEFLKDLLNFGITPAMPATTTEDAQLLSVLAGTCKAEGLCLSPEAGALQPLQQALVAAGLEAPGLSAAERAVLTSGASASAGIGALVVVAGRQLLAAATAVAALSCEAFGAQVRTGKAAWTVRARVMPSPGG